MAGKDYYLILGVARSESPTGIRARYRDLVRTLHPDVAGAQSTGVFREVTKAYEVLADPVARRRYNGELAARERPIGSVATPVAPRRTAPVSLLAEPWAVRPSFATSPSPRTRRSGAWRCPLAYPLSIAASNVGAPVERGCIGARSVEGRARSRPTG
jgi:curved DNA-binding protein CbpA